MEEDGAHILQNGRSTLSGGQTELDDAIMIMCVNPLMNIFKIKLNLYFI